MEDHKKKCSSKEHREIQAIIYCKECKIKHDKFMLKDRLNNKYPLIHENCLTHIMHHTNINKIDNIEYYKEIGINNYRLEFFDEDYNETKKYIQRLKNML